MKTQLLKLGMPLVAFLMAIAFAFATETKPSETDDALVSGYIMASGFCEPITKNCDRVNSFPCKYEDLQVFEFRDNPTSCSVPLYHSQED